MIIFFGVLAAGMLFVAYSIYVDVNATGTKVTTYLPFLLLLVALLIALVFEFVNGFHDTANAVATVMYTDSLPVEFAVMWSGFFNFLGVLLSSGAVAFGIVSLLPVELILQVGSSAGFAMVFALLIAAIIWNLGTWYFGLPASSSHTLIGSIIGVGLMNQLMGSASGAGATSGVDWGQAAEVGKSLLFSPLVGFAAAGRPPLRRPPPPGAGALAGGVCADRRHRRRGRRLQVARRGAAGGPRQHAQRHVPGGRGAALDGPAGAAAGQHRRLGRACRLS